MSVWDIWETGKVLFDDCASVGEKALSVAMCFAGFVGPRGGYAGLAKAAHRRIDTFSRLHKFTRFTRYQRHHLLERRFIGVTGHLDISKLAIALTKKEHQAFTNAWRRAIPYRTGTQTATLDVVLREARHIYRNHPEILKALGL